MVMLSLASSAWAIMTKAAVQRDMDNSSLILAELQRQICWAGSLRRTMRRRAAYAHKAARSNQVDTKVFL